MRLQEKPGGPHPRAHLQVLFTRVSFTYVVNYLVCESPDSFSILVHQMTDELVSPAWLFSKVAECLLVGQ